MKRLLILFLFLWLIIFTSVTYAVNVDIKSELYHYLERLSAYGLLDSAILGTKPIDRKEFARLTLEASKKAEEIPSLPNNIRYILEILKEEFRDEIKDVTAYYIKPLREANLKYSLLEGKKSVFPNIKAFQEPFNYNNEGVALNSQNVFLDIKADARYGALSVFMNPVLYSDFDSKDIKIHKGYIKLYLGKFSFEIGKNSLWWGQGRHGSLILTNNAEPFKLLRITNEIPINIPLLGLLKFDFFLSKLEKNRDFPKPFFGGLRINIKPNPWLELSFTRTAITGGKGMPKLRWSDIGTIIIGRNLEGRQRGESNQIAGFDFRIRINPLKAYFYGEAYGEDEAGMLPYKWAYIVGLYFSEIYGADLRIEYADTAFRYPGWYTHSVYTSGYTYKGRLMGHHMGGDAKDLFVSTSFYIDKNTTILMHYNYEKRGNSKPNPEIDNEFMFQIKRDFSKTITFGINGGYEIIKNSDFIKDQKQENRFFEAFLKIKM